MLSVVIIPSDVPSMFPFSFFCLFHFWKLLKVSWPHCLGFGFFFFCLHPTSKICCLGLLRFHSRRWFGEEAQGYLQPREDGVGRDHSYSVLQCRFPHPIAVRGFIGLHFQNSGLSDNSVQKGTLGSRVNGLCFSLVSDIASEAGEECDSVSDSKLHNACVNWLIMWIISYMMRTRVAN